MDDSAERLRVCIIAIGNLGVPAVHGGAVETLIDSLAKKNREKKQCNMTIVARHNAEAIAKCVESEHTRYRYLRLSMAIRLLLRALRPFGKFLRLDSYLWQRAVCQSLKKEQFDVVIVESAPYRGIYRKWKKIFRTKAFLLHMHSKHDMKKLQDIYSGFLAISPYMQRETAKHTDENKVFLLNNCIDTHKFLRTIDKDTRLRLQRLYHIEDKFVFLFCGRTVKEKGVKELILAFREMREHESSVLLIAGNANFGKAVYLPYDAEIRALAQKDSNIRLLGYVPNDELYKLHNIAQCSVVPSLFEEPQGLVVLEGMCSGNAMIASDAGAIPDYVSPDCGIIVKRGDNFVPMLSNAMDYFVRHPKECREMGENGQKKAMRFNEDNYYDNFVRGMQYFANKQ